MSKKEKCCKKKKSPAKIAIIVLSCLLAVSVLCTYVFADFLAFKQGEGSGELWLSSMEYTRDYSKTLYKEHDKDFVILNFTDTQITFPMSMWKTGLIYKTMKAAVDEAKPDLITLTGDQAWGLMTRQCYKKIANTLDSFGIPWAFVYGNHDREGNGDLDCLAEIAQESKYCLFEKGPRNVTGVGNYSINIVDKETNEIVHTVIMMDSGDSGYDYANNYEDEFLKVELTKDYGPYYDERDAKTGISTIGRSYSAIMPSQIDWYEWLLEGIQEENNGVMPESTCFFHIPLMEYNYAYLDWVASGFDPAIGTGRVHETSGSAKISTGFFEKIKEVGSTKTVVCGHDHINDSAIYYEGVLLAYGVKTGKECYWENDGSMNGGTQITIGQNGKATLKQIYIPGVNTVFDFD